MKIILAAGGSGGHIFPALALAKELGEMGCEVAFAASTRQLDKALLEPSGYRCHMLSANPMPYSKNPLGYAVFFAKLIGDVFASAGIVLKERPDAVVGFGGYSSGTISLCARIFGVPLVIHEQNYFPGRANMILSGMADLVALSFDGTEKYLARAKGRTIRTGNPLRADRLSKDRDAAAKRLGLGADGRKTVLIMGGSQGARTLNRITCEAVRKVNSRRGLRAIHLTGRLDYEKVAKFYEENNIPAKVFSFLDRMEDAYAVSDIAITRSGASAVFELAYYGMPMVLVPYPNPRNNQRTNALFFAERGAAVCMEEKDLTFDGLAGELESMISDGDRMKRMAEAASAMAVPDAARRLANAVVALVENRRNPSRK